MTDSARKIPITIRNPKKQGEEIPSPQIEHNVAPVIEHKAKNAIEEVVVPEEKPKHRKHPAKIISDLHKRITSAVSVKRLSSSSAKEEQKPKDDETPFVEDRIEVVSGEEPVVTDEVEESEPTPSNILEQEVAAPALPTPTPVKEVLTKLVVPIKPILLEGMTMSTIQVAYFCMEIGLTNSMPTYAGGLGILAGDMLKSCADLKVPMIGVSLLHRKGFFRQRLDESGWQFEEEEVWDPSDKLMLLPHEVSVILEGRTVRIKAWLYKQKGIGGNDIPVIFLDTDVVGNAEEDRHITDKLYDSDRRWRLLQEAVLGIGGTRMLEKIGATNLLTYHMNEGHAAFLTLELFHKFAHADYPIESVRSRAVFTTHTPVAAGHDVFEQGLVHSVLGVDYIPAEITNVIFEGGKLNMTRLGFFFSHHINGVAKKHREISRELFPGYQIESITNGVYAREWTSSSFAELFDRYLPGWQQDPHSLRYVLSIPLADIWNAHESAKKQLISYLNQEYHADMRHDLFTIGFARRATSYKRASMLFSDLDRLMHIADNSNGLQIVFAGKAHPSDREGKLMIQHVIDSMRKIGHKIHCVYVEDYDMEKAKLIVSGVDLWLNTPTRPQEASGTSGMKAALNGVPQLSVLDGWWLEGHIEHVTGWSIGPHPEKGGHGDNDQEDTEDMYQKLERVILPCFDHERDEWVKIMRQSIAINGSFFNSHRMVEQYVLSTYFA